MRGRTMWGNSMVRPLPCRSRRIKGCGKQGGDPVSDASTKCSERFVEALLTGFLRAFRAGVGVTVGVVQAVGGYVRVNLRRAEAAVAEQFLDATDVGPGVE